jgi:hypothetical protein
VNQRRAAGWQGAPVTVRDRNAIWLVRAVGAFTVSCLISIQTTAKSPHRTEKALGPAPVKCQAATPPLPSTTLAVRARPSAFRRRFSEEHMVPAKNWSFGLVLLLSIILGPLPPATADTSPDAPLSGLTTLRWQHRIILVDGQQVPTAIERLREAQEAIDERDVLWFVNHQGLLQSNYPGPLGDTLAAELERRYFSRSNAAVFLIGKDGGLKASDRRLDLPRLFELIDAMPMRRQEMEAAE